MHTVMWTFKVPAGMSKAQLIETVNSTAHTYEGIPGLIRKIWTGSRRTAARLSASIFGRIGLPPTRSTPRIG